VRYDVGVSAPNGSPLPRLRLGELEIDSLTFEQALDRIEHLVDSGNGGSVYTPNIDHVVNVDANAAFREAYQTVDLSLVDGKPLLWASKLLGAPLPEKISGADIILPLMKRAGEKKWRVYLLGAGPGVAPKAADILRAEYGVNVVGTDAPMVKADGTEPTGEAVKKIRDAQPQILLVAFGSPKQELFIHRVREEIKPAVALAIGAGLDFIAGAVKRSPRWMSDNGLEWLYRLSQEPRRLWRRYLVNDPKFALILYRTWRQAKAPRA
jgi:N-acetylglucosaminyldiphosphoundecaprenol N-acetyl-beta-D-mannosaminyltransferase